MEDIESIHSMETFEDDEGERPYTVEGEGLAARIENAFSMPAEIYRSSSEKLSAWFSYLPIILIAPQCTT